MSNSIIVFEGPDNCGKSTQIAKTEANLIEKFINSRNRYIATFRSKFPNYNGMYGSLIKHMLTNSQDYDLKSNIDDMNLFSILQADDKINELNEIYRVIKSVDYTFFDRYTLSSRIYDSVLRSYLYKNTYNYYSGMTNGKIQYYHGERYIEDSEPLKRLYEFFDKWVFTEDYFNDDYLSNKIKYNYKLLEHKNFNIKHVLFRSCKALERITKENREFDQYEEDSKVKRMIKTVYDFLPDYLEYKSKDNKDEVPTSYDSWIVIDTTATLSKLLQLGTKEDGLSSSDEEVMYNYCKENSGEVINIISNEITDKLYDILK
jgi:thymidylate kinase